MFRFACMPACSLGVDHDKISLLSTPFPTIQLFGKNCRCDAIVLYVVLYCIVLYCIVLYMNVCVFMCTRSCMFNLCAMMYVSPLCTCACKCVCACV